MTIKSEWRAPLAILLVCLALYFLRLGSFGIVEGGESYYPASAREMVEAGDLIVPRLNYQLYFSKPIITFWLMASAYYMFGVTEFAGRFWSAFFCTAMALTCYWTTRSIASARAGLIAALILASSPLLIATCRRSSIDVFFSGFLALAVCACIMTLFVGSKKWWPLIWTALALGVMTKGPAALVLFGLGSVMFLVLRRPSWGVLKQWFAQLHIVWGSLIFTAIVVPWFVAIGIATKGLFLKVFFVYENLARFIHRSNGKHAYLWWYIIALSYGFLPWCVYLPLTLWNSFKSLWQRNSGDTSREIAGPDEQQQNAILFTACSAAATIIFFSISKTQFDTYVLPAWCPLAMLMGINLDGWLKQAESAAVVPRVLKISSIIFAILGLGLLVAGIGFDFKFSDAPLWMRVMMPIAGVIFASTWTHQFVLLRRKQFEKSWLVMAVGTCIGYSILTPVLVEYWYKKMFADVNELARSLENSKGEVVQYDAQYFCLLFYRKGPIDFVYHLDLLVPKSSARPEELAIAHTPVYVIIQKKKAQSLLDRPGLNFKLVQERGDWCLYQSDDALLRRSPTLEASFEPLSWQDMLSDRSDSVPLTMPFGGGTYPPGLAK